MTQITPQWRVLDGALTAWFDTGSLSDSAALAGRILDLSPRASLDLRGSGLQVRLDAESREDAEALTAVAEELGAAADPGVLQEVSVVIGSAQPGAVSTFWEGVLDQGESRDGALVDPLRRDPTVRIRPSDLARPLRDRFHLDVSRPAPVVERVSPGEASGPYGLRHADPDGNEVDQVPGDGLGERPGTSDWQAVFSTMACYRATTTAQQSTVATLAASMADEAGFPLLIDLRPGLVILDSGKDQGDQDAHGLDLEFADLAERLQLAAREHGATADRELPRFVQLVLDAVDIPAVRSFWVTALGYVPDGRDGVTDIHDPRRLGPVLVFQDLDPEEGERRRQRNRIHLELSVPADRAPARVEEILAAGGRPLEETDGRRRLADPEGNELVIRDGH